MLSSIFYGYSNNYLDFHDTILFVNGEGVLKGEVTLLKCNLFMSLELLKRDVYRILYFSNLWDLNCLKKML